MPLALLSPFWEPIHAYIFHTSEAGFGLIQVTSEMVTAALGLYFKRTSLRKIVGHLDQFCEKTVPLPPLGEIPNVF